MTQTMKIDQSSDLDACIAEARGHHIENNPNSRARYEAAKDVKPGVISMAHAWGDTPGNWGAVREKGSSTNRLSDDHRTYDKITGQPRMTAIPVNLRHVAEDAI